MDSRGGVDSRECVEGMRLSIDPREFGYKIQAIAAHVLLRLGYRIVAVKRSGHPDIVASIHGREFRFEVEAEVFAPRLRKLTDADLASLTGMPSIVGYYALCISFPSPRWILVPAEKLVDRKPSANVLLEALSNRAFSDAWTREYTNLLRENGRRVRNSSSTTLARRALVGRGL